MGLRKGVVNKPHANKLLKLESEVRGVAFKTDADFVLREANHKFLLTW